VGLTISYQLRLIAPTIDIVQEKVAALRTIARELAFMEVGEIVSLQGQECVIDMKDDGQDPHLELKVHGSEITGIDQAGKFSFRHPSQIIGFGVIPGEGCSGADFGFRGYLLDAVQKLGIKCDVTDNGDYWKKRDLKALASTVTSDNQMMAMIMGAFKDIASAQDATLKAPILDFPNFEYLEGEGQRS
jgi:hypothetical protein